MLQTKKLRSKSWKTRVFFTFRLPILDGRVHEQVSSVLFFTVFFEGERHDLSKTGGFGRKMPPPPGKPVTFYECHPEDHAPAPSVRADFSRANMGKYGKLWEHDDNPLELYFLRHTHMAKMNSRQRTALKAEAPAMFLPEQLQALLMD